MVSHTYGSPDEHGNTTRTAVNTILSRGRHLSYQRGKHEVYPNTSLIKIEGVDDTNAAK